jgi:hypothetical protein
MDWKEVFSIMGLNNNVSVLNNPTASNDRSAKTDVNLMIAKNIFPFDASREKY